MKTKAFLFLIAVLSASTVFGQDSVSGHPEKDGIPIQTTFVELGGSGILYSLNYDVLFDNGFGIRVGGVYIPEDVQRNEFSFTKSDYYGEDLLAVLVMGEYNLGKGPNRLELSAGILFGKSNIDEDNEDINVPSLPAAPLSIGYRWLPQLPGKATFKLGYTPIISTKGVFHSVGLSIGFVIGPEDQIANPGY